MKKNHRDFQHFREYQAQEFKRENQISVLTAKEAMINATFLYPDDTVPVILNKLKQEETNVCVVVNKKGHFIGEISDGNIIALFLHQVKYEPLTRLLNVGYVRNFRYKSAKQLINRHNSTVYLDTPINKVIQLIYKNKFCYIPVIDHTKKVVGVVTPSSIIDLLREH